MIIIDYEKKYHKKIIHACVAALKQGKVVAYPTDTSYGLAADATNTAAIKKLYKIKERQSTKPVHIVVPSVAYAKTIARWNSAAGKLAKKFWPGALTLVLPVAARRGVPSRQLSAGTNSIGLRMPNNQIAMDLAKFLKQPITATSANPSLHLSGGYDSYSANDIVTQFGNKKFKPDIIIDAGKLPKNKPSTVLRVKDRMVEILRPGPISEKQIIKILK